MVVTKYEEVLFQGTRDIITGLWRVPLQSLYRSTNQSKHLHQVNGKDNDIKYLHEAAFIQVQYTWAKADNRYYLNKWTGITAKYIHKMTKADAIIKGHITQSRKKVPINNNQQ